MFAATTTRVAQNTCARVNQQIEDRMQASVARCAAEGVGAINQRLKELEMEWDVERMLETNFASLVLIGSALGLGVNKRFMLLPAIASGFMLQHVTQGWCPPLIFLRRMGYRTADEIDRERYALKALRGDFDVLHKRASNNDRRAERAIKATEE
jgi:hypothetical protein